MAAPTHALRSARGASGAAGFLCLALAWTFVSAATSGGSPYGVAGVLLATAVALTGAAALSGRLRWLPPAIVVGVATVLAVLSGQDIVSSRPLGGPFAYANATGGFYLQAAIAGVMLAGSAPNRWARLAGTIAAVAFAGIVIACGSAAAAMLLALPVGVYAMFHLSSEKPAMARATFRGMGALLAIALIGSAVIGAIGTGEATGRRGVGGIDERRQALWHDALTLLRAEPFTGVGPGRFSTESPVARSDADARWAHNGFLQFGAETGVTGLVLLLLVFMWAIAGLASAVRPDVVTVLGAAAVVAFGIGASVDYLMHFPALPVAAAALAGTASIQTFES